VSIERIDPKLCNGCGICFDRCPMDVIRIDEQSNKAIIKYFEDCISCSKCELDCLQAAIYVSPARPARPLVAW